MFDPTHTFSLGKPKGDRMLTKIHAGSPLLVNGEGEVVSEKEFKTVEEAVREATRIARKTEDEVYVYVAKKRIAPSDPKIESEDL